MEQLYHTVIVMFRYFLFITLHVLYILILASLMARPLQLSRPIIPPTLFSTSSSFFCSWILSLSNNHALKLFASYKSISTNVSTIGLLLSIGTISHAKAFTVIGDPASLSMALIASVSVRSLLIPIISRVFNKEKDTVLRLILTLSVISAYWLSDPEWPAIIAALECYMHMAAAQVAFWLAFQNAADPKTHTGHEVSPSHSDSNWLVSVYQVAASISVLVFLCTDLRPFATQLVHSGYFPLFPLTCIGTISALIHLTNPFDPPRSSPKYHLSLAMSELLAILIAWTSGIVYDRAFAAIRIILVLLLALVLGIYTYIAANSQYESVSTMIPRHKGNATPPKITFSSTLSRIWVNLYLPPLAIIVLVYALTQLFPRNFQTAPVQYTLAFASDPQSSAPATSDQPIILQGTVNPATSRWHVKVPHIRTWANRVWDEPPLNNSANSVSLRNLSISIGTYPGASARIAVLTQLSAYTYPDLHYVPYWSTWDDPDAYVGEQVVNASRASPKQILAFDTIGQYPVVIAGDLSSPQKSPHVKWFRMLFDAYRKSNSSVSWFMLIDDDTLVFPDRILIVLQHLESQGHDPTKDYVYVGQVSEVSHQLGSQDAFGFGGAGVLLSRALLADMAEFEHTCMDLFDTAYGGDGRLGLCVQYTCQQTHRPVIPLVRVPVLNQMDLWEMRDIPLYLSHKFASVAPGTVHHYDAYPPIAAGGGSVDDSIVLVSRIAQVLDKKLAFRRIIMQFPESKFSILVTFGFHVRVYWDQMITSSSNDGLTGRGGRVQDFWIERWSYATGEMVYMDESSGDRVAMVCGSGRLEYRLDDMCSDVLRVLPTPILINQ